MVGKSLLRRATATTFQTADVLTDGGARQLRTWFARLVATCALGVVAWLFAWLAPGIPAAIAAALLALAVLGQLIARPSRDWSPNRRRRARADVGRAVSHPAVLAPGLLLLVAVPALRAYGLPWLTSTLPTAATWLAANAPTIAAASTVAAAVLGAVAGHAARRSARRSRSEDALATALAVSPAVLADSRVTERRDEIVVTPTPPTSLLRSDIEARLGTLLPGWSLAELTPQRTVLRAADATTLQRRATAADSGGLVIAIADELDGEVWTLAPDVGPSAGERLDVWARARGLRLIEFDPHAHRARAAALPPQRETLRDRFATALRVRPWELELEVDLAGTEGSRRPESVRIVRGSEAFGFGREKRLAVARELVLLVPGGSSGWAIIDDVESGVVELAFGEPRRLPDLVPLGELLQKRVDADGWSTLPLGVGADGGPVSVDLLAGPHSLVVGPTGSGKTVVLLSLISQALTRGHEVVLVDPTKAGLDFASVRPWCAAWAGTLPEAQATVEAVYAEVGRRKAVLQREGEVKWSDLSPAVHEAERIRPVLVVVDEVGSLLIPEEIPKALDRDHPFAVEAGERNAARAIIQSLIGRIAREARFAGIHLALALQRPDATIIGGELRSNLTSAVQLAPPGKPLSADALRMVLPGELAHAAAAVFVELDDGHSRGLGVIAAEGGAAIGFRASFAPMRDVPALLEAVGVERPRPWPAAGSHDTPLDVELESFEFTLEEPAFSPTAS